MDLHKNKLANELAFTQLLKRAEETSKKISNIEAIYDDYAVDLRAPKELGQLDQQIDLLLTQQNISASKFLS